MAELPVVNASPLIHLSRAGLIHLLQVIGPRVIVPACVADEVRARGPDDQAARALAGTPWLEIADSLPIPTAIAAWDLGAGETAVLTWACSRPGSLAILDDQQARRCAASMSIPVVGTLGVVLKAKANGMLPLARPVLAVLVAKGMYLSDRVIADALLLAGE